MSGVDTLVEMGFLRNRAEKAWAIMGDRGVQAAMEWLLEHNEDPDIDEPYQPPQGHSLKESGSSTQTEPTSDGDKTRPAKAPDTPEEKAAKLQQMQAKIHQRRTEREEMDRKREIELEVSRRKDGQDLSKIKSEMHWKEAQRQADIRKREKREDLIARQRVKEQIAKDREEKKAQLAKDKAQKSSNTRISASPKPSVSSTSPKKHTHTRIQIRLPNGSQMVEKFGVQEQLSAVRLYIDLNRKDGSLDPYSLMTTFPKHVFTDEDHLKPLEKLGLVPSAVLIVTKPR